MWIHSLPHIQAQGFIGLSGWSSAAEAAACKYVFGGRMQEREGISEGRTAWQESIAQQQPPTLRKSPHVRQPSPQ